jgi:hypothetical protein
LAEYLNSSPPFHGKLALSGLFTFLSPQGPFWDFFKARIVFPYWKSGKVVYMTARATIHTSPDRYECYTDADGNIKAGENGKPQFIKYKKLRTQDLNDDKRKYISKFIQNDAFMGEDVIRGAREVIITEGAPDWISAVDKGFAAVSPVTTSFREQDWEKLGNLTSKAGSIYIINDNEDNAAGLQGAKRTAQHLSEKGKNVFIVQLPKPAGAGKIDLNEYLVSHSASDLRKVMEESHTYIDLLIEELPTDYIKAQSRIKEEVAPAMLNLDEGMQEYYIGKLKKKVKTTPKVIRAELEHATKVRRSKSAHSLIDSQSVKEAQQLALDPMLLKKRLDIVNSGGVVGERNVIAMYFAALDSRLLPENNKSPNVLAVKNAGHFGAGKSFTLMSCLEIYPEPGYCLITNGSPKSLYHLQEGLKHKALIVTEGFQFQERNATDSELVYVVRSLISEGRVSYQCVEKDESGKLVTVIKKVEGPTSFITTTVMEKLEAQFEDRLFTVHPDETVQQTKDIINLRARMMSGTVSGLDKRTVSLWKALHSLLKPVEVIIPFAPQIAGFLTDSAKVPISARRAFNRVLAVTQTIACTYQYQRKRDFKGRLIAEYSDYYMAVQIVREAFRESLGQESRETEKKLAYIKDNGPINYGALKEAWAVTKSAISGWISNRVREGIIVWCDESGMEFPDENEKQ